MPFYNIKSHADVVPDVQLLIYFTLESLNSVKVTSPLQNLSRVFLGLIYNRNDVTQQNVKHRHI